MKRISLALAVHTLFSLLCPITMAAASTFIPSNGRMCPVDIESYQTHAEPMTISAPCSEQTTHHNDCLTTQTKSESAFPMMELPSCAVTPSSFHTSNTPLIIDVTEESHSTNTLSLTTVILLE